MSGHLKVKYVLHRRQHFGDPVALWRNYHQSPFKVNYIEVACPSKVGRSIQAEYYIASERPPRSCHHLTSTCVHVDSQTLELIAEQLYRITTVPGDLHGIASCEITEQNRGSMVHLHEGREWAANLGWTSPLKPLTFVGAVLVASPWQLEIQNGRRST